MGSTCAAAQALIQVAIVIAADAMSAGFMTINEMRRDRVNRSELFKFACDKVSVARCESKMMMCRLYKVRQCASKGGSSIALNGKQEVRQRVLALG